MELLLTGQPMSAQRAKEVGLVWKLVEPDELLPTAMQVARTLAGNAPIAVREAKRLIDDGIEASLESAWTLEQRVLSGLYNTADAREGIQAFIDKRDPVFGGLRGRGHSEGGEAR